MMVPVCIRIFFALCFNATIFSAATDAPLSPRGRSSGAVMSPKSKRRGSPPPRKLSLVIPRNDAGGVTSATPESPRSPRIPAEPETPSTPRSDGPVQRVQYKTSEQADHDQMEEIIVRLDALRSRLGDEYTQAGDDLVQARAAVRFNFTAYLIQARELLERVCPRQERHHLKMSKTEKDGVITARLRCCFDYMPSLPITADVGYSQELDEIMTHFYIIQWQWFCGTATDKEEKVEAVVQKFLPLWNALDRYFFLWKLHEELTGTFFTCT